MNKPKGILIPVGGNEDKGVEVSEIHSLEFISEGILFQIVEESGGPDGLFVIVPTASSIPDQVAEIYIAAFEKLGCHNIHILNIRTKEEAASPAHLQIVEKANCVMFSGGDQSRITDAIHDTPMHRILADRYMNEVGFVIAGTSAGAMVMSQEMIAGGSAVESFIKGAVKMYYGFGLLPNVMIDTHFIRRGRFGRLSEAIAIHPCLIGIGLAEDTGLIIKRGNEMEIIGSGMVIIFDGTKVGHNNHNILEKGTPLTISDIRVHVLSSGDKFFLNERKIIASPLVVETKG